MPILEYKYNAIHDLLLLVFVCVIAMFLFHYVLGKHRGLVVDSITYVIQGDREQFYEWSSCGFKLSIPKGIVKDDQSFEIVVTALAGGKYNFPKGADLTSVVYDVEVSDPLLKEFTMEIQHCVALKMEGHLKSMTFGFAPYPPDENGSMFKYVDGGEFHVNSRYGSFKASKTGSYCIFVKR